MSLNIVHLTKEQYDEHKKEMKLRCIESQKQRIEMWKSKKAQRPDSKKWVKMCDDAIEIIEKDLMNIKNKT